MNLTILTIGSRGDIQPIVALGKGLSVAGYNVTIATHAPYEDFVTEHGLGFFRIDGNPQELMEGDQGQAWMESGRNPLKMLARMRDLAMPMIRSMAQQTLAAVEATDVLLFTTLGFYPALTIREKIDIPTIGIHLQPIQPTTEFSAIMMPSPPDWLPFQDKLNKLSHTMLMRMNWYMFRKPMNAVRAELLDLPPMDTPFHKMIFERYPLLMGYSPHVIPRPHDWHEHVYVTGYWFLDEPDWTPPAALLSFLDAGEPPIYIGFGSMTNRDPHSRTQMILDALQRTGQRGILMSGWGGLQAEDVPESVMVLDSAPHSWLFPRMKAVVHHGGAGTTAAGLRAGIPSILVPHFVDQPFWGKQVASLGVGPQPIQRKNLDAQSLTQAIGRAITDKSIQHNARQLGEKIRAEEGIRNAVNATQEILATYDTIVSSHRKFVLVGQSHERYDN